FVGLAWAIASYFVLPVIVTENTGPVAALKRSAAIIKKTWGEALTAQVGLFAVMGAGAFLSGLLVTGGTVLFNHGAVAGGILIALGIAAIFATIVVGATLQAILTAALYLYAADGAAPRNFDGAVLREVFARK